MTTSEIIDSTLKAYVDFCNDQSIPRAEIDEKMLEYMDMLLQNKEAKSFKYGWNNGNGHVLHVSYVAFDDVTTIHFKKHHFPYLTGGGTASSTDAYDRAMKGI
jgi:hypothetical protein